MTSRLLELGIQSIQNQQPQEGARLIRIALRRDLPDALRAVAYLWLAETALQPAVKLDYLRQALAYDPHNEDIRRRMSALMTAQLPPTAQQVIPNPAMAAPPTPIAQQALPLPDIFGGQPPLDISSVQHVVAVSGGPNGTGAGCIVHPQGVIATTRHVVGMNMQVDVFLREGQALRGVVVRSYPLYDLALVRVNAYARQVIPAANPEAVTENLPLTVLDHRGQALRANLLPRREVIPPHWFPTTLERLPDAGGNPVYDPQGQWCGLLTDNTFRGGRQRFGLHAAAILTLLGQFATELQQLAPHVPVCCPACGSSSRALIYGGFYCETCGSVLPQYAQKPRYPQANTNTLLLYNETNPPCQRCGAQVGMYRGKCLRCEVIST
ncbi:MAG: serine protease [Anaerolineae bacterium]